jgi:hypothetical protein
MFKHLFKFQSFRLEGGGDKCVTAEYIPFSNIFCILELLLAKAISTLHKRTHSNEFKKRFVPHFKPLSSSEFTISQKGTKRGHAGNGIVPLTEIKISQNTAGVLTF